MYKFDKVKYWLWPNGTCGRRVLAGAVAGVNSLDKAGYAGKSFDAEGIHPWATGVSPKLLEGQDSGQTIQEELKESQAPCIPGSRKEDPLKWTPLGIPGS